MRCEVSGLFCVVFVSRECFKPEAVDSNLQKHLETGRNIVVQIPLHTSIIRCTHVKRLNTIQSTTEYISARSLFCPEYIAILEFTSSIATNIQLKKMACCFNVRIMKQYHGQIPDCNYHVDYSNKLPTLDKFLECCSHIAQRFRKSNNWQGFRRFLIFHFFG